MTWAVRISRAGILRTREEGRSLQPSFSRISLSQAQFLEDQEWNCWKGKEYGWYQEEDIGCRALYCSNKQEYCYPKLQSGGKSRKYHHNPTFTQPWIICNSPIGIHPRTDWHESDKNLNFLDIRQLPVLNKLLWSTICRKKSLPISRWVRWFSEMD